MFYHQNGVIKAMPFYNIELKLDNPKQVRYSSWQTSTFASSTYWEKNEDVIDMNNSRNNIQKYIEAYRETLKNLGAKEIEVRVARYSELNSNGVTNIMRQPSQPDVYCDYWIGSGSRYFNVVFAVGTSGNIFYGTSFATNVERGVRPIIIIK